MLSRKQYLAGKVRRWHTHHSLTQTNADHSWGVAMVLMMIVPGGPTKSLLEAALLHDVPEYLTGDMPSYTKHNNPELAAAFQRTEKLAAQQLGFDLPLLTQTERYWLSLADALEAWLFVRHCGRFNDDEMAEHFPIIARKIEQFATLLGRDVVKIEELMA